MSSRNNPTLLSNALIATLNDTQLQSSRDTRKIERNPGKSVSTFIKSITDENFDTIFQTLGLFLKVFNKTLSEHKNIYVDGRDDYLRCSTNGYDDWFIPDVINKGLAIPYKGPTSPSSDTDFYNNKSGGISFSMSEVLSYQDEMNARLNPKDGKYAIMFFINLANFSDVVEIINDRRYKILFKCKKNHTHSLESCPHDATFETQGMFRNEIFDAKSQPLVYDFMKFMYNEINSAYCRKGEEYIFTPREHYQEYKYLLYSASPPLDKITDLYNKPLFLIRRDKKDEFLDILTSIYTYMHSRLYDKTELNFAIQQLKIE